MEDFYSNFYLIYSFFTLVIILDLLGSFFRKKMIYLKYQNIFLLIFLVLYYFIIATRSVDVGADTLRYFNFYESIRAYGNTISGSDLGFTLFSYLLNSLEVSASFYLYFVSLLFVLPVYFAIKQFKNINKVYLLWFFASLFIFISMSINILRQGIGGVFVMWGISLFLNRKDKSKTFLIPLLIAPLFHLSLLLVIAVFFGSRFIKNIKWVYGILFISIILSYIGFNINDSLANLPLVGTLFKDRMDIYLSGNEANYKVGFRIDFLFFNLLFIFIGYYISKLKGVKEKFPLYNQIYTSYILLTSYFILMFNVPYSDRFGILSWIFIPFIMYPIFDLSTFKFNKLKLGVFVLGISLFIVFNVISV